MNREAIEAFNQSILYTGRYNIIDYVKHINKLSSSPIKDLAFMDELITLIKTHDCVIPHTLLVKYGVLSDSNVSSHVSRMLEQYNFIEGQDYLLSNVGEQVTSGTKYMKNYFLHPRTFKLCIMRAKNTDVYAKYYLLLEEAICYYDEYQRAYDEYLISQKDTKIDELSADIKEMKKQNMEVIKQNEEQSKEIRELLSLARDTKDDINTLLDITTEQIEEAEEAKAMTQVAANDRINVPTNKSDNEMLIVLEQLDPKASYKYYVIRGTKEYARGKYKQITKSAI